MSSLQLAGMTLATLLAGGGYALYAHSRLRSRASDAEARADLARLRASLITARRAFDAAQEERDEARRQAEQGLERAELERTIGELREDLCAWRSELEAARPAGSDHSALIGEVGNVDKRLGAKLSAIEITLCALRDELRAESGSVASAAAGAGDSDPESGKPRTTESAQRIAELEQALQRTTAAETALQQAHDQQGREHAQELDALRARLDETLMRLAETDRHLEALRSRPEPAEPEPLPGPAGQLLDLVIELEGQPSGSPARRELLRVLDERLLEMRERLGLSSAI